MREDNPLRAQIEISNFSFKKTNVYYWNFCCINLFYFRNVINPIFICGNNIYVCAFACSNGVVMKKINLLLMLSNFAFSFFSFLMRVLFYFVVLLLIWKVIWFHKCVLGFWSKFAIKTMLSCIETWLSVDRIWVDKEPGTI